MQLAAALRAWPRSVWAGLLLALAIVLAAAAQLVHSRQAALEHAHARAQLLARLLDEHAARSFDTASLALAALAQTLGAEAVDSSPRIGQALSQTLAGLPLLRVVAVLDPQGRVLASTDAADVGASLSLRALGPLPAAGRDRVGGFVAGRGLRALVAGATADAPAGVGFVPLVRRLEGARGLLLVGLINPDAIANHQTQTLAAEPGAALLATLDGRLVAATDAVPLAPGAALATLPALERQRAGLEHGSAIEAGLSGAPAVVAHRAARSRPLLTVVELPLDSALAAWASGARRLGGMALLVLVVVLALTVAAGRSAIARDRARLRVAAREAELSVLVSSVQELIFRTDAAGQLSFVSPRWSQLSTLPAEQALGRHLADCVAAGSREAALQLFARSGAGTAGGVRRAQLSFGEPAQLRHYEVHVRELLEGQRVAGFAGSAVDLTDRLASQARLSEQLAFNERLLEMLPLPVSMTDARGRYVVVNQAWEQMTGHSRERVLGLPAQQFMTPGEAELHSRHDAELLAAGAAAAPVRYEASVLGRGGARRDLAITKAGVTGPGGQAAGVLMASMDVTEQRAIERAVREARDAAEEASRAKSEFIANISHELRTPLQSIIGFSELGEQRGRAAAPKLSAMFGDIHRAGQRMLALVNDLLDVSRIESTVGTFHLERTDLRPLVREVARELEPLLAARQLHIAQDLGPLPLVAKVDPMRFQQVIRNVLANAIRFSPSGASIELRGELDVENQLHFDIRDHGPGIPPAELEKIFEAFVQSSRTKDGSGGTGLGLAICRKIVEAQGGSIRAANAPGGGSLFRVSLPARGFAETQPGVL